MICIGLFLVQETVVISLCTKNGTYEEVDALFQENHDLAILEGGGVVCGVTWIHVDSTEYS